jgi:signal transduction histidine kinase
MLRLGEAVRVKRGFLKGVSLQTRQGIVDGLAVLTDDGLHHLYPVRRPLPTWIKTLLATTLLCVGAALIPPVRVASVAALRRWLVARESRDAAVDNLLVSLAAAGHGKLAVTSAFRRLCEQIGMLSVYDADPPAAFSERFRDLRRDVLEVGIPEVQSISEAASRLGLAPGSVTRLRASLRRVRDVITALPESPPGADTAQRVHAGLLGFAGLLEDGLLTIARAAEGERSSALGAELGRVLDARGAEMRQLGVESNTPDPCDYANLLVLGTRQEVAFILDNLLGNAIDAVRAATDRRVVVNIELTGSHAVVTFEDTGRGVPENQHEAIFLPGVTGKVGGGQGLSLSRDILAKRNGSLTLRSSVPGKGAVFELRLAICR